MSGNQGHGVPVAERFWGHVDVRGDDCWSWTGCRTRQGYGETAGWDPGSKTKAHRMAWMMAQGVRQIPAGVEICHRCDNPPCCNPAHLFAGTKADNMRDMASKGRQIFQRHPERSMLRLHRCEVPRRGQGHGMAKLTDDMVKDMRQRASRGISTKELAFDYGICVQNVRRIVRRATWRHLP